MSILEPIDTANLCGEDYKYDDEYLALEVEIEKSFTSTSEEETKWDFVLRRCEKILKENSKDLKVLTYWLYAQRQLNGWSAFINALEPYSQVITTYNTALYPQVGRRKIKVFEWLEKVIEAELSSTLEQLSESQLTALSTHLSSLETSVPLCVESDYVIFKDILYTAQSRINQAEREAENAEKQATLYREEESKRQEAEAQISEAQQIRRSEEEEILSQFSPSLHAPITTEMSEDSKPLDHESIDEIVNPQIALCKTLFEKSVTDYLAFKMLFSLGELLWEEALEESSIMRDDFLPSADIVQAVRELSKAERVTLSQLQALIDQLLIRPTWLEGYYIASQVLYKLEKTKDAEALESLLIYLIHRKESLLELKVDGKAVIEGKMLAWTNTKLLSFSESGGSSVEYQRAYQEIMIMRKEQNAQNALALLEEYYQNASGEEERFRWRLLFVDFALEIGDKNLAFSLLLDLERLIEKYQIDKWQPELAIATYEILLKPMLTQEIGSEGKVRIYNKLSILAVQKVINL